MKLTPRQQQILQLIVKLYGETAEPIGSRTLLQKSVLNVSPATIRNDMVALEQLGYLMKAHSSSGRIPSDEAYQYYVDKLIEELDEHHNQTAVAQSSIFVDRYYDVQQFVIHATEQLAEMMGYPVAVMLSNRQHRRMRDFKLTKLKETQLIASLITDHGHVESQLFDLPYALSQEVVEKIEQLVQSELCDLTLDEVYQRMKLTLPLRIQQIAAMQINFAPLVNQAIEAHDSQFYYVAGKNHLFDLMDPQLSMQGWKSVFDLIDGNDVWYQFLDKEKLGINMTLNFSNPPFYFKNISIITAKSEIANQIATFAIVGPSTMPYRKVISRLQELLLALTNY